MESEDNVAVVRRMWAAYHDKGLKAILAFAAPDAVWRPFSAHGRAFHDTEAYRQYIETMEERQEIVEAQLGELHAAGDWVVVSGRLRIRGPDGIQDNPMHWVHRFRDGLIVETMSFSSLDAALEAAGLGEAHRVES